MSNFKIYHKYIDTYGFEECWKKILNHEFINEINPLELPDYYEDGLAYTNKVAKKETGKYYTPEDVANVMADMFIPLTGQNICDVCCGTGNLLLPVLKKIGKEKTIELIKNHQLYLYDIDAIAVQICKYYINQFCEQNLDDYVNITIGNFLSTDIHLPQDSKVISNPPYGAMKLNHYDTLIQEKTKDFYSSIMEKIVKESIASVIITPHSFMGSDKFKLLRKLIGSKSGYIVSFDNVPGNIFNGTKFGIFNSNNANSVRAAITVIDGVTTENGIRVGEYIRFKNETRNKILQLDFLTNTLNNIRQTASNGEPFKRLRNDVPVKWLESNKSIKDYIITKSEYSIDVPTTCRYFTVGAKKNLNRKGKHIIYAKDIDSFYLLYGLINSSYCYYYHRIINGGITYPIGLLKSCPAPIISAVNMDDLKSIVNEMMINEENFISLKKNAGKYQENIKFPTKYREQLNTIFAKAFDDISYNFAMIHSNDILNNEVFEDIDDEDEFEDE